MFPQHPFLPGSLRQGGVAYSQIIDQVHTSVNGAGDLYAVILGSLTQYLPLGL